MNIAAQLIHRCGDRGWLVDVPVATPAHWTRALRAQSWVADLIEDVVPSDTSVLVTVPPGVDMDDVHRRLAGVTIPAGMPRMAGRHINVQNGFRTLIIPVRYDGCDLADVAHRLGLTEQEVVELHTGAAHTVGFFGFAPGFAYLRGLPEPLQLPRRADPRTLVDAGAIAIAGRYSVVYPGRTPGGWHILGSTTERLWNLDADPPNRLNVGDVVRFEDVT